jgi:putative transposase
MHKPDQLEPKKRGRPSKTGLKRLRHCVYNIHYHIVFTTKFRRPVITAEILEFVNKLSADIVLKWDGELLELNGEADHIHLLVAAPPNLNLSQFVGNLKTITSRMVRKNFSDHVRKFYWKPFFWNSSYCILSTGGAPIEVIRRYIEAQGKPSD